MILERIESAFFTLSDDAVIFLFYENIYNLKKKKIEEKKIFTLI